jgi:two-component system, chemotaxis family, sensor histidine kinase and response regulator PixL
MKGAAANVGLPTIELIAHEFEDVARVFYDLEIEIDTSIQSLLLDGYSALDECLNAQIMDREIDESAILDRMTTTLEQLKVKLGDWSEADIPLPTAMELGFDIVASIFETTIQEQIDEVIAVIATNSPQQITECLHRITETCISLAESFELPGFLAVNTAIVTALSAHPDRIREISILALANLQQAQADVIAGDRTSGGTISADLAKLAQNLPIQIESLPSNLINEIEINDIDLDETKLDKIEMIVGGEADLPAFQSFLVSNRFSKRHEFSTDNQHLFNQIIRLCWDWFRHEIQFPQSQLNLELLVSTEGLVDLEYIHHWIGLLSQGLSLPADRINLRLYRECCIYQVVFAVAKYLAETDEHSQFTPELLSELRLHLQAIANTYKQQPLVTANERGWIDRIILPHHWDTISAMTNSEDSLLSEIWGQSDFGISAM